MPLTQLQIETDFIKAFVQRNKRDRWETLLPSKNRVKILNQLYHCHDLDHATPIDSNKQNPSDLIHLLESKGAPTTCHIISTDPEYDGKVMNLEQAIYGIQAGSHTTPSIIICIPAKLALYEGEEMKDTSLLCV